MYVIDIEVYMCSHTVGEHSGVFTYNVYVRKLSE